MMLSWECGCQLTQGGFVVGSNISFSIKTMDSVNNLNIFEKYNLIGLNWKLKLGSLLEHGHSRKCLVKILYRKVPIMANFFWKFLWFFLNGSNDLFLIFHSFRPFPYIQYGISRISLSLLESFMYLFFFINKIILISRYLRNRWS